MSLSMNLMKMTLKANSIVEAHTTVFMHKNLIYKHSCSSNEWSFKKVFVGYKCFVTDKDLRSNVEFQPQELRNRPHSFVPHHRLCARALTKRVFVSYNVL